MQAGKEGHRARLTEALHGRSAVGLTARLRGAIYDAAIVGMSAGWCRAVLARALCRAPWRRPDVSAVVGS
jgi:hypothetical protein